MTADGLRSGSRAAARAQARARSRAATRTAVLTVALPSMATLGVFGAAAVASLGTVPAPVAQAPGTAPPTTAPPTGTGAGAEEAADRATRSAARQELARRQQQQEAAEEQRRKERERPRFTLPVADHGLSARFGESSTHWLTRHTGIDFPVRRGTPVRAVTDGTVRTRWNTAYGYMAQVTAPDGTQTWYCHLATYRVRRGQVRAGDVIAYSGSSGNSTGPHLHFEVRPPGAGPVDPLPWLLERGLDPR
ncbi:M23 family metallopeptidase [Kitasatospora sp. GP82]|uniref:M23 family metallopeptidase n=1 Tax=Kitasatospora sp. GP82 TaxID=3035089 RepID=UPI002474A063|nr:M23 family metallopeptidase [Kitasatospora sp. GP82]MDH6124214.1 murein DD-endopeptidase MepM/ murein hydrolase activator NlpD [Kitasatospora sp. GP82]